MLTIFRAKKASLFIWVIIVLLIIGLAGFGIGTSGLATANVARVGDREISQETFLRTVDQEIRAISQQLGRTLTTTEARQFGIDRLALARLINDAALDEEADRLELSTGDEEVARQIRAIPAFQALDGSFDPEAYRFALDRSGLTIREFEDQIRREATRELIAASLQAPAAMPDAAALTVLGFLGERRGFSFVRLGPDQLADPLPAPTEEELATFYAENPDLYTRPETREITYARLTLEDLAPQVEVSDEEVAAALEAEPTRFDTPERRFVDRIGFPTADDAADARARLDAGEVSFEDLAAERELTARDIDQGLLTAGDLAPAARDAVFGAEGPGIVGPVETPLGPSLYRINGVVAGQTVPAEEAATRIREELSLSRARDQILDIARDLEDLVAGGASVEEIAEETPLALGELQLNAETTEGVAADPAFREAAEAADETFVTDPIELEDGSIAVLRVDAVLPPTVLPLEEVREDVAEDWAYARVRELLTERAETLSARLSEGEDLGAIAEELGVTVETGGPLTRGETVPDAPPALVAEMFAAEQGGTAVLPLPDGALLARLDTVEPFDPEAEESQAVLASVQGELDRQIADDMLSIATQALQLQAGVTVNESVVQSSLAALP